MSDKVIKAYLATYDENLRILYDEKKTQINELTVIASVYKNVSSKQFYCLAVIVNNGEYLFEDVAIHSRYYPPEEVESTDIATETISAIKQQLIFRRRLLTFISNNPKLPSILSAAYNKNLLVYYLKNGRFRVATLFNGVLTIDLPAAEQVYLSDLLEEFRIKVVRSGEGMTTPYGLL